MSFNDHPLVIGHRGAAGLKAENTLPSFRAAYAAGVNAVELDVYWHAQRLWVIHDDTLERTTNGEGTLNDYTLEQLRDLDAGEGHPMPYLTEVLAELPDQVGINIELKGPGTAGPVADLLMQLSADVLVSSFDHDALRVFRELDDHTPVAPLYHHWPRAGLSGVVETAGTLTATYVNLSQRIATQRRIRGLSDAGLDCLIYTVNRIDQARKFIAWGAKGVFTDRPDLVRAAGLIG